MRLFGVGVIAAAIVTAYTPLPPDPPPSRYTEPPNSPVLELSPSYDIYQQIQQRGATADTLVLVQFYGGAPNSSGLRSK